ncbi:MAG: efflux RND transporter periplasmic adaptor subunit [Beijerinckiaceae bacterium]
MIRTVPVIIVSLVMAIYLLAQNAMAHEGHDHGAPPPPVSSTIAPRADASSDDFELVVIARGDRLALYLDGFRDNAPVTGAQIEVDTPQGTQKAAEDVPGVYSLAAPWVAAPGLHNLAVTINSAGSIDVLTATLVIPQAQPSPVASEGSGSDLSARLRAGLAGISARDLTLMLVGAGAFFAGIMVSAIWRRRSVAGAAMMVLAAIQFAGDGRAAEASATPAPVTSPRDVAQRFADGTLFVPKSTQRILAIRTEFTEQKSYPGTVELPGRIIPDPNGAGYVQASVAGRLMPPTGGFPWLGTPVKAGDVLAHVHPAVGAADVTSQQQQARDLDQQIALVTRRLERLQIIQNVVARAQIEDAELELSGLKARRANLDRAPKHIENLVAPVSGVIAAVTATAGQIAETNSVIFQIVDPARFWVEALSYEAQALGDAATGKFADGRTFALEYRGAGLADRNQAIPVQFSISGETKGLRAGQLLTVLAKTTDERAGIAVPRAAVLRGANGQSLVFEHTNAERFVPREVRTESLDGARVLIVSGVDAGKRIVTQGAELLNQIR